MKTYLAWMITIAFATSAIAQQKAKVQPVQQVKTPSDTDLEVYNRAVQYGDYDVAKNSLYRLLVRYPDKTGYLDSLVILYYSLNAFPQCVLAGTSYLEIDSVNLDVMEMVALSYSALKRNKETISLYEKMYQRTGKIHYAYQLAVHQYLLKRIGECNQMIDIILNDPLSVKESISISMEDGRQQVPLKAAAFNLRGIILNEINRKDIAKENFESALKVFPDFTLAKKNLDVLNEKKEKAGESGTKDQPKNDK